MVWIDNPAIPRQYFPDLVEARKMAILWLENNAKKNKATKVFFYEKRTSRNYYAYVKMDDFYETPSYSWHHPTKKYGMASTPLYKNGKLRRA